MIRKLALIACLLTVCITAASAFIRHWQGGTGCEARADCARATAAASASGASGAQAAQAAQAARGAQAAESDETPTPVLLARVAHRIAAMLVGIIAIVLVFVGWSRLEPGERVAAAIAFALTAGLAWLGLHTPSELPLVTVGNVAGGFALAAAFAWVAAGSTRSDAPRPAAPRTGSALAWTALGTLIAMTVLGVLIGARGALDGCPELLCLPQGLPQPGLFDPRVPSLVADASGARALHLVHRVAGILLAVLVLGAALRLCARLDGRGERILCVAVCLGLLLQAGFGAAIAGGVAASPAGAAAHNAVAALLAVALAALARRSAPNVRGGGQ